MQPSVVLYSQPTCGVCRAEKEWLAEQHIVYEDRNIQANPDWIADLKALGSHGTPTTIIDSEKGQAVILGFQPEKIAAALAR